MDFTPQRKKKGRYNTYCHFDKLDAKNILIKLVYNLEGIFKHNKKNCLCFVSGTRLKDKHIENDEELMSIETEKNKEYINSIEKEIMYVFKENANWCNQRKSKNRVCNMLRWIIRQIYKQPVKKSSLLIHDAVKNYQVSIYPLPPYCIQNKYKEFTPNYIDKEGIYYND